MKLTIWPQHCITDTPGHEVFPLIGKALKAWEKHKNVSVEEVKKGENLKTEMYSVLSAIVEDPKDPKTAFNEKILSRLLISDKVIICGPARSHVVKYTLQDILEYWRGDLSKLCLLEDVCSSFPINEKEGQEFFADMRKKGLTVVKSDDVFPDTNVKKDVSDEKKA